MYGLDGRLAVNSQDIASIASYDGQRPEAFLSPNEDDLPTPICDYR